MRRLLSFFVGNERVSSLVEPMNDVGLSLERKDVALRQATVDTDESNERRCGDIVNRMNRVMAEQSRCQPGVGRFSCSTTIYRHWTRIAVDQSSR